MKFTEFNLHEDLLKGIEKSGYEDCTPVQEQVLKAALDGSDLYVQSQTGTGKTAAYLIPVIQELLTRKEVSEEKILVMVPTRELAVQVEEEAKYLADGTNFKTASLFGGVGYGKQLDSLKKNPKILVGTPGRIIDLQEQKKLDLRSVGFLVIDEADRMFDMGFYPDLRKILKCLPESERRQTMLFSATLNSYVKNLAWEYTRDAKEIEIECENITVDEISQQLYHVSSDEKMKLLLGILAKENPESVLIFCNTKKTCELVSKRLKINSIESEYIIGDLPQSKRLQVMNSFKNRSLKCLVATDVAARGIDVDDLEMVVNFDLPNEAENYVHRIGRTARAGKSGKAISFCSEHDVYNLPAIERYIENTIPAIVAFSEDMAEDKSEGVYIRLERYDDEEERGYGRGYGRNGSRPNRKGGFKKDREHGSRSEYKGRQNGKRYENGHGHGHDGRNKNRFETGRGDQNLEGLSFEQRLEVYKKKYQSGKNQPSKNKFAAQNGDAHYKKGKKFNKKNGDRAKNFEGKNIHNRKTAAPQNAGKNTAEAKKPGLFERIKSFFGKKTGTRGK